MMFCCNQLVDENALQQTNVGAALRCGVNVASFLLEAGGDPINALGNLGPLAISLLQSVH
jgi:hypothetical protein